MAVGQDEHISERPPGNRQTAAVIVATITLPDAGAAEMTAKFLSAAIVAVASGKVVQADTKRRVSLTPAAADSTGTDVTKIAAISQRLERLIGTNTDDAAGLRQDAGGQPPRDRTVIDDPLRHCGAPDQYRR